MTQIDELKKKFLAAFHSGLTDQAGKIASSSGTREQMAREINSLAGEIKATLAQNIIQIPKDQRPNYALVLQYCFSVASLEYRHKVWPYEYMAFSRRVGELWEAFCRAAWDYPSRASVARISTPDFGAVRKAMFDRIKVNIGNHEKREEIIGEIDILFEIIGDINMREDEMFEVEGTPHVIDFKSGFGSNEKGNMLRLQTVGQAYRIWNPKTRLLLLVRQEENNNYLRVLRRSGLWEVHTGDSAYERMSELTGADMQKIRKTIINWPSDLSEEFYGFLKKQDLASYLIW
jgi:hypothetical protein